MGVVTCWNITEQLRVLGVGPLPPERNVSAHGNYDPHRRVHRDVLKSNLVPPVSSPYARRRVPHVVKKEFQWKAHTDDELANFLADDNAILSEEPLPDF